MITVGFPPNTKVNEGYSGETDIDRLFEAVQLCETVLETQGAGRKGYIIQKVNSSTGSKGAEGSHALPSAVAAEMVNREDREKLFFEEFHPFLHMQHKDGPYQEFPTFDRAVDVFFSEIESQKMELKTIAQEAAALKKLENVRVDHERRLEQLQCVHCPSGSGL